MVDESRVEHRRAKAHPTKAFFVRMLTRDISLEDCILDLIDNSIDAAWASSDSTPTSLQPGSALKGYKIELAVNEARFRIKDNCGGISLDDAAEYAFTFGRDRDLQNDDFTIGVYGIGMKRAVFKLGDQIRVTSTPPGSESFSVPINVSDWLADPSEVWDFDIDPAEPLEAPGVEISVDGLSKETSDTFTDPGFVNRLMTTIARDYLLALMQGLEIHVNTKKVEGWDLTFLTSQSFQPMRDNYSEGEVSIEIIAGMATAPPASDASERKPDVRSGWYVLCNGRVVMAADRTSTTVWGVDKFPGWHPQYGGFVGVVLFSSTSPELLPMTTTKKGVDTSSAVYRRAVAKMFQPTRAWIDYTNARKPKRDELRQLESAATPTPIGRVQPRKKVKLPAPKGSKTDGNILYNMPIERIRRLGKAFGRSTMSYREVGTRSFEFAYQRLVDED